MYIVNKLNSERKYSTFATIIIKVVDAPTAGNAARVVVEGFPEIEGNTMAEKMVYVEKKLDCLRKAIVWQPRGHETIYATVITEPVSNGSNFGLLYMDGSGYWKACGHLTMAAVTVAVALELVKVVEPITRVSIDTPTGLVTAEAYVENGIARKVTVTFPYAFFWRSEVCKVPNVGKVHLDVACCGHFFAYINAKELGLSVCKKNLEQLIDIALKIKRVVNEQIVVKHPENPLINEVEWIMMLDEPSDYTSKAKSLVVGGSESIPAYDRSPCGSGTCGLGALLSEKGQLKLGEEYVVESIIGTKFTGRVLKETKYCNLKAVIPTVTGSSYITGINYLILDPEDPLKYGFCIRDV